MGYRHTSEEILEGALDVAFDDGLSRLTYGRVAKQLGISDRVVVYYFPSKEDLVGEVLASVGIKLQQALEPAFGFPAEDHLDLVKSAWPIVAQAETAIALLDGLLLLRQMAGPAAADRAARRLVGTLRR
jgi:AcrR family transcriptional regulator